MSPYRSYGFQRLLFGHRLLHHLLILSVTCLSVWIHQCLWVELFRHPIPRIALPCFLGINKGFHSRRTSDINPVQSLSKVSIIFEAHSKIKVSYWLLYNNVNSFYWWLFGVTCKCGWRTSFWSLVLVGVHMFLCVTIVLGTNLHSIGKPLAYRFQWITSRENLWLPNI